MNKAEFKEFYIEFLQEAADLAFRKQADYTGETDDPFSNFRLCETFGVCGVETGIMARLLDKTQRRIHLIKAGVQAGAVEDEKLRDTIMDELNYLVFLAAYLASITVSGEPETVNEKNN